MNLKRLKNMSFIVPIIKDLRYNSKKIGQTSDILTSVF